MANIRANFSLKEPRSETLTLIYLKSYYKNRRLVISTGITIHPTHWDDRIQRPITLRLENIKKELRHSVSSDIQAEKKELEILIRNIKKETPDFEQLMNNVVRELNNYEKEFANAVQYLITIDSPITVEKIKSLIEKKIKPEKTQKVDVKDFWSCFEEFLEARKSVYAETTIKKYKTLNKRLLRFEKQYRYKISFESINLKFYDKYKTYLLKHKNPKKENEIGLMNDTISKEFSGLKAFMNWSLNRGYHSNISFQSEEFSAKKRPKQDQISLTKYEFDAISRLDLSMNPKLERVRDLFCFSVYTGQRWSEIESFNKEQIQDNTWVIYVKKTGDLIKIPLVGFIAGAIEILKKYNYCLPKISQQKFNEYIKEAGKEAGINSIEIIKRESGNRSVKISKPRYSFISSHTARRTFVTLMMDKGIPISHIQKITGHKDIQTLMRYEHTSEEAFSESFKNLS